MKTEFELRKYRVTEEGNHIFEEVVETIFANQETETLLGTPKLTEIDEANNVYFEWFDIGIRAQRLHNLFNH